MLLIQHNQNTVDDNIKLIMTERRQSLSIATMTATALLAFLAMAIVQPTLALRGAARPLSRHERAVMQSVVDDVISDATAARTNDDAVAIIEQEEAYHRALSASSPDACMEQASGISLGCTAQDIKFHRVRDFDILSTHDGSSLLPCNCTTSSTNNNAEVECDGQYDVDCGNKPLGTVFGACSSGDPNERITVQMNVDFLVSTKRYDIGMYIATHGGSALNGNHCLVSSLQYGTYGDVTVWEVEGDTSRPNPAPDNCLDLGSSGLMADYPFAPIELSCFDENHDGLLDFDIGIVWSVKKGDYYCDIDNVDKRPVASSSPKCWYDDDFRVTLRSKYISICLCFEYICYLSWLFVFIHEDIELIATSLTPSYDLLKSSNI